jgi:hypothetical protein
MELISGTRSEGWLGLTRPDLIDDERKKVQDLRWMGVEVEYCPHMCVDPNKNQRSTKAIAPTLHLGQGGSRDHQPTLVILSKNNQGR